MRISRKAAIGCLIRSARLFSEAWRCAPTVVFSPRLNYTLVSLLSGHSNIDLPSGGLATT
ncbi:BQ5605_C028g10528 [Microbotryum silenes-dioicae]|uniref:BQ5605_C028g10528 protein n=1 Tax=Microbotryum silenes-dioicae TaxID=796604 RepID=A0A2X0PIW3_9BASI|nr:BQ5605_C028g10528 [Microbotryum silenes-dioicae]